MEKVLSVIMAMAMTIGLGTGAAQGKGKVEKNVPVTQFDEVSIAGSFTVRFTQGKKHECTIIASPEDMEKLKAEAKDRQLNIYVESEKKDDVKVNGIMFSTARLSGEVIVNVTSPKLNKVNCMGSGDFIATTDIKADDITFKIAGSGDIILKKVSADKLHLSIAGSGDIDLQQTNAKKLDVSIAGSGDIKLKEVDDGCEYAYLWVAGSGDIDAMFSGCQELKCNNVIMMYYHIYGDDPAQTHNQRVITYDGSQLIDNNGYVVTGLENMESTINDDIDFMKRFGTLCASVMSADVDKTLVFYGLVTKIADLCKKHANLLSDNERATCDKSLANLIKFYTMGDPYVAGMLEEARIALKK